MSGISGFQRTSLQLYRDCLRLVQHVAPGRSAKHQALKATVRQQFKRQRNLEDPDAIQSAQANAIRALSNYMLTTTTDPKVGSAMKQYTQRSVQEAKAVQQSERQQLRSSNNGETDSETKNEAMNRAVSKK